MAAALLDLTETMALAGLRTVLQGFLPALEIIRAEINRVAEPAGPDFIEMTPVARTRLGTNVSATTDVVLTASITGTTMIATATSPPVLLAVGQTVIGPNVLPNTVTTSPARGGRGARTYDITPAQTVASQQMYAGTDGILQATEVVVQLDIHGPDSADYTQILSTVLRDAVGFNAFAALALPMNLLYIDEPRQTPFINEEQQYEFRWSVDVHLQCNPTVTTLQQFAAALAIGLISVENIP